MRPAQEVPHRPVGQIAELPQIADDVQWRRVTCVAVPLIAQFANQVDIQVGKLGISPPSACVACPSAGCSFTYDKLIFFRPACSNRMVTTLPLVESISPMPHSGLFG